MSTKGFLTEFDDLKREGNVGSKSSHSAIIVKNNLDILLEALQVDEANEEKHRAGCDWSAGCRRDYSAKVFDSKILRMNHRSTTQNGKPAIA